MKEKIKRKYLTLVLALFALVSTAITASASTGESTIMGISVTWFAIALIVIGIILAVIVFAILPKKFAAMAAAIIFAAFLVTGLFSILLYGVETPEPTTIEDVGFDVTNTPTVTNGNATVGDKIITCRFGTNATGGALTYPLSYSAGDTETDWVVPCINFTFSADDDRPFTSEEESGTLNGRCYATLSDQISIDGTTYNFFDKTTGSVEFNQINWTYGDNTDYEEIDVSLALGESSYVTVTLNPNRAALSQLDAYESKSMTLDVLGDSWQIVFSSVADNDNTA